MSFSFESKIYSRAEWYTFCIKAAEKYPPIVPLTDLHINYMSQLSEVPITDVHRALSQLFMSICGDSAPRVRCLKIQVPSRTFHHINSRQMLHQEVVKAIAVGDIRLRIFEGSLQIQELEFNQNFQTNYPNLNKWYLNPKKLDFVARKTRLLKKIQTTFSYLLYPEYQTLSWRGMSNGREEIRSERREIQEGIANIYHFLRDPTLGIAKNFTQEEGVDQLAKAQLKILAAFFKGFLFENYLFIDALNDWALLSNRNRKQVDRLFRSLPLLELFMLFEIPKEMRLSLFKNYHRKEDFQEFVIESTLNRFKEAFIKKRGWYPFDDVGLFLALRQEEIRQDLVAYLFLSEKYLLLKPPPFEPSKSHELFLSHRIFLQMVPEAAGRETARSKNEGKKEYPFETPSIKKSSLDSEYKKFTYHFYKMIQNRDKDLNYPQYNKPPLRKNLLIAYELFCDYKKEFLIKTEEEFFLFIQLLRSPMKVQRAFLIVKKMHINFTSQEISTLFIYLLKEEISSKTEEGLSSLLALGLLRLKIDQILTFITENRESDLVLISKLFTQFQSGIKIIYAQNLEENEKKIVEEYLSENFNKYLQILLEKEDLLNEEIHEHELYTFSKFIEKMSFLALSPTQKIELWFLWLQNYGSYAESHPIKIAGEFLLAFTDYLGVPPLIKDSLVIFHSLVPCQSWVNGMRRLEAVKNNIFNEILDPQLGKIREIDFFAMSPDLYKEWEEILALFIVAPPLSSKLRDKYEDAIGEITARFEKYYRVAFFSTYQHIFDNFYVKKFSPGKAHFSLSVKDQTDQQYNHNGKFFEVLPGVSMMTGWYPPIKGGFPLLVQVYLREIEGQSLRAYFLIHPLHFSANIDLLTENSEKEKISNNPLLKKEPSSNLQEVYFDNLRRLAKYVLLEGRAVERVSSLTSTNLIVFSKESNNPEESEDNMTKYNLFLEYIESQQKNLLSRIPGYSSKKHSNALDFLDSLKKESRKAWVEVAQNKSFNLVEQKSKNSFFKGVIETASHKQETFYDEKKRRMPYKNQLLNLSMHIRPALTSQEITPEVLQEAYTLIKTFAKNTELGLSRKSKKSGLKIGLCNACGVYKSGILFLTSDKCYEGYKVTLGILFHKNEKYTMQPFVYSLARLENPEKFSNFLSTQLLLLKMLYLKKSDL